MFQRLTLKVCTLVLITCSVSAQDAPPETLAALDGRPAPANFQQMWSGFDPRREPLEVETLKRWEEDGVVLRVVRFRIGLFRGTPAKLAAVYGFPKGQRNLPGLLQIHGGGQYADAKACIANAKRGYATLSIAWAGRISSSQYSVNPDGVRLFWEGKTDDPNYRVTTDWGVLDGYHAPSRHPGNQFPSIQPASWTLDRVESPRNSGWFLCAVAARRALTFLEQQPEVDPQRLGVYGHSMGGKLTVMTASDQRVKAAAPSCGGISDRYSKSERFRSTLGDDVSLREITCPIIFLSPANDFHGRIGDLATAVDEIKSSQWRVTCSPHHNHQDTAPYEVATLLWFDQHLQGTFTMPATPESSLVFGNSGGVPKLVVSVDPTRSVRSVDVFYTQHGKPGEVASDMTNTVHRFWRHAPTRLDQGRWVADLPVPLTDKTLWAFANVHYELESPVSGAGYYYGAYLASSFNLSSLMVTASPERINAAGTSATLTPTPTIETFEGDWEKEWFSYRPQQWARTTHKLYDIQYRAPHDARLAIDVRSSRENLLVVRLDDHAAEVELSGGEPWQPIVLSASDFKSFSGLPLTGFQDVKRLKLSAIETLRPGRGESGEPRVIGKNWAGDAPEFRNLRWLVDSSESGKH